MIRIKNWEKLFENNRSREVKDLDYVALPNRHDGSKYAELMDHPEGPLHFAAWVLMVQIASRTRCGNPAPKCRNFAPYRGCLVRGDGSAHTTRSLYHATRCPEKYFLDAIPRLLQLGWIEEVENTPFSMLGAGLSQDTTGKLRGGADLRGGEGSIKERSQSVDEDDLPDFGAGEDLFPDAKNGPPSPLKGLELEFERARAVYPGSRRGHDAEWGNFKKKFAKQMSGIVPILFDAVTAYASHLASMNTEKKYIANFTTWINQQRWTMEYASNSRVNGVEPVKKTFYNPLDP